MRKIILGIVVAVLFIVTAYMLSETPNPKGRMVKREPKQPSSRMLAQAAAGPVHMGADTSAPYEWTIDTTQFPDGPLNCYAVATDAAGNQGTSETVTFIVDNSTGWCNDNGICETDEDCEVCPNDCFQTASSCCGNDFCEIDETCSNCETDCGVCPFCGDGTCNSNENYCNCTSDCGQPPSSERMVPNMANFTCQNGMDDDCDGLGDCDDPDCAEDPNCAPPCTITQNPETTCNDGEDNDCDGKIDCLDEHCVSNPACVTCTPTESTERSCSDGIDNDCDTTIDCGDADCASGPPCVECGNSADCADGNLCTDESCVNNNCVRTDNSSVCNDGLFCTAEDKCVDGVCTGSPWSPCTQQGQVCNETNNTCDTVGPPLCNNNGICDGEENCTNCSNDCALVTGAVCGNSRCETKNGENCLTCPSDCHGKQDGKKKDRWCCGDGAGQGPIGCNDPRCNSNQDICTTVFTVNTCCGDGSCDGNEGACDCRKDCGERDLQELIGSSCRDGIDNDCDLLVDCNDPDCFADGGYCDQGCNNNGNCDPGETCQNCSRDCSGVMKGKPSNRYCCGNGQLENAEGNGSICDGNP